MRIASFFSLKPLLFSLMLMASPGLAAGPAPIPEYLHPGGRDVTSSYFARFNDPNQATLPGELQDIRSYKFIFIRGIMGNFVSLMGKTIMKPFKQFQYFDDQISWLKSLGVETELLRIETEDPTPKNARVVKKAVERSTRPVILVGHSKGSADVLQFLLDEPQLRTKVAAFLSMQGAIQGTPVADYLIRIGIWHATAKVALTLVGGSGESLHDLGTDRRISWIAANQERLNEVIASIPTLAFATWKDPEPGRKNDCMFSFSRDVMLKNTGLQNDGLVPWRGMVLPGARYVLSEGQDHAAVVTNNKFIGFDRVRSFKALLGTLFEKGR